MRILYTLLVCAAVPLLLLRLLFRARREPRQLEDVGQRLGLHSAVSGQPLIWLHLVSVGETRAAQSLISAIRQQNPDCRILLTQMTAAGRVTAEGMYGSDALLTWLPWDLPWAQRRFLRAWRPVVGIILETEVWPNLLAECERARVPLILANARMSERSARRYGRVPALACAAFRRFHAIAAQTEADAVRFCDLGAENVSVTGNLKFDNQPTAALVQLGRQWRQLIGPRKVVLLSSTRDGEETLLLSAFLPLVTQGLLIVLVPRHPQRFNDVASILTAMGIAFHRRSAGGTPDCSARVWLGDSMGEMFAWYAVADIAVIGGSWLPLGGQNLIEACAVGCPVIVGPHTFNFAQATEDALAAGAAVRAADALEAATRAAELLEDGPRLAAMSAAGRTFAETHRGATARCMALIEPLIKRGMAEDGAAHRP